LDYSHSHYIHDLKMSINYVKTHNKCLELL